jgi:hypothetical protein
MLEDVHGHERISRIRKVDLVYGRLDCFHARIAGESSFENREDIFGGFDAYQRLNTGSRENLLRESSDTGAYVDNSLSKKRREPLRNPAIIIPALGNCRELSA